MSEFLINISSLVGTNQVPKIKIVNKTKNKPNIDNVPKRIIQKLAELTALDTDFYLRVLDFYKEINYKTLSDAKSKIISIVKSDEPESYINIPNGVVFKLISPSPEIYIERGAGFDITIIIQSPIELLNPKICFHILDINNKCLLATNTSDLGLDVNFEPGNPFEICFSLKADFPVGRYFIGVVVQKNMGDRFLEYMWINGVCAINVVRDDKLVTIGSCQTPVTVKLSQATL